MSMNRTICLLIVLLTTQVFAENNDDWLTHYVQAEKAYAQRNGPLAIEEYTKAIELTPNQLCLYMGRGKTYEKMKRYELALQDFSFIINYPNIHNKDLVPALWARARMYLILHDYDSMHKDYEAVTSIDQNTLETERNEKYLVLRNINSNKISDANFQEKYALEMVNRGYCKSTNDVMFTNNGVAIIELKHNCGCQKCQEAEAEAQKKNLSNPLGCIDCGIDLNVDYETRNNNPTDETNCHYWCKRLTESAEVLCEGFETIKCKIICKEVVKSTRDGCLKCCNNDGFYKNCVKPFENFLERVGCEENIW